MQQLRQIAENPDFQHIGLAVGQRFEHRQTTAFKSHQTKPVHVDRLNGQRFEFPPLVSTQLFAIAQPRNPGPRNCLHVEVAIAGDDHHAVFIGDEGIAVADQPRQPRHIDLDRDHSEKTPAGGHRRRVKNPRRMGRPADGELLPRPFALGHREVQAVGIVDAGRRSGPRKTARGNAIAGIIHDPDLVDAELGDHRLEPLRQSGQASILFQHGPKLRRSQIGPLRGGSRARKDCFDFRLPGQHFRDVAHVRQGEASVGADR